MKYVLVLLVLLTVPCGAVEVKLSGAQIHEILNDVTLTAQEGDKRIVQIFQRSGVTLYNVDGQQSQGFWRVENDKYCSQWPPREYWDCFDVTRDGEIIQFIAKRGKRYAMHLLSVQK